MGRCPKDRGEGPDIRLNDTVYDAFDLPPDERQLIEETTKYPYGEVYVKPYYFTDTHINAAATKQLRLRGLDVVRCEEVALAEVSDETLLTYAADENRVLISCDRDFIDLHFRWLADERHHAGIIYLHPDRHCKHIGEIVRIVMYWHSAAEVSEDLYNDVWEGDDAQ